MARMHPDSHTAQTQRLVPDTSLSQQDLIPVEFGLGLKQMILAFIIAIADALIFAMYLYQMLGAWHQWFEAATTFLQILVVLVGFIPFCLVGWKAFSLYVDGRRSDIIEKEIRAERRAEHEARLAAVYSEVRVKDAQARKHDAEAEILYAEADNKRVGAGIPAVLNYDANGNPPIVFDSRNWAFHQFAIGQYKPDVPHSYNSRVEMVKDPNGLIAAPTAGNGSKLIGEAIPAIIRYEDVAEKIPADQSLLGIHPETSQLEIVPPEQLKTVWFVGGSNMGKTNTVFGKVGDCVRWGCKVSICDQHAHKRDGLAGKLQAYKRHFLHNPAMSDDEIKEAILHFLGEFHRRRMGGTYTDKLLIVVDEVNGLCEHVVRVSKEEAETIYERYGVEIKKERIKMRVFIQLLVETCGYESRGFDMFGFFISQKAADLYWLRKAAMTVFVHGLLMKSEAMLACNDNADAAALVMNFKKGRTYIYGYEVDHPMELQQPLYGSSVVESTIQSIEESNEPKMEATPESNNRAAKDVVQPDIEPLDRTLPFDVEKFKQAQKLLLAQRNQNDIICEVWQVQENTRAFRAAKEEWRVMLAYLASMAGE